jgi:hypothetical protein
MRTRGQYIMAILTEQQQVESAQLRLDQLVGNRGRKTGCFETVFPIPRPFRPGGGAFDLHESDVNVFFKTLHIG